MNSPKGSIIKKLCTVVHVSTIGYRSSEPLKILSYVVTFVANKLLSLIIAKQIIFYLELTVRVFRSLIKFY